MASKKKVIREPKPTPAKFLVTIEEVDRRLRRSIGGFKTIAVKLPKQFNNAKWIKQNLPFNKGIQDIVLNPAPDSLFISQQILDAVKDARTCNSKTAPLMALNRYCYVIGLNRDRVMAQRFVPFKENNVLFFIYTDDDEDVKNPYSQWLNTFNNRMYYNEEFHALVIDKWDAIPSYRDSYILLKQG